MNEEKQDQLKQQSAIQKIKDNQNLFLGIIGGAIGALIGAGLWVAVTVGTNYQVGWMAVGVGFLTGYGVRFLGKGIDPVFGITGAVLSLVGCLAGAVLSPLAVEAFQGNHSLSALLNSLEPQMVVDILSQTVDIFDLAFYGFAAFEGYRLSINPIAREETT
ncbi:MAG: hypothetical protein GY754_01480 [bacterium]|nr:hypothetical protein [bacterium]